MLDQSDASVKQKKSGDLVHLVFDLSRTPDSVQDYRLPINLEEYEHVFKKEDFFMFYSGPPYVSTSKGEYHLSSDRARIVSADEHNRILAYKTLSAFPDFKCPIHVGAIPVRELVYERTRM